MSVISNPTVYTGAPASMEGRIAAEQKTFAFLESLGNRWHADASCNQFTVFIFDKGKHPRIKQVEMRGYKIIDLLV